MNALWIGTILCAAASALVVGKTGNTADALMDSGAGAVKLMITLWGSMGLWSGLMEILREAGDLERTGLFLRRILSPLFPKLQDEPCWQAMSLNLAANVLGLGNAATPAGMEAARLLAQQGPAGLNALAMLLVLNNSGLQLMPTTIISLRAAAGSADPAGIWGAELLSSMTATVTAAVLMSWRQRGRKRYG